MLDEQALRVAAFCPGSAVCLADGQCWVLPTPSDGAPGDPAIGELGAEYEGLVRAVMSAETESERRIAELCLGIYLLGQNYELRPQDYRALLEYPPGAPELVVLQGKLREVAIEHARHLAQRPPVASSDGKCPAGPFRGGFSSRGDPFHLLCEPSSRDRNG